MSSKPILNNIPFKSSFVAGSFIYSPHVPPSLYLRRFATYALIISFRLSLRHYGQYAAKSGCCYFQPSGGSDVILYCFIHTIAANDKNVGPAEQVAAHVDSALMFFRNFIVKEQIQCQHRADWRKSCLINRTAIICRLLRYFEITSCPCCRNICQWPFHYKLYLLLPAIPALVYFICCDIFTLHFHLYFNSITAVSFSAC